jgi:hypothetical protein
MYKHEKESNNGLLIYIILTAVISYGTFQFGRHYGFEESLNLVSMVCKNVTSK